MRKVFMMAVLFVFTFSLVGCFEDSAEERLSEAIKTTIESAENVKETTVVTVDLESDSVDEVANMLEDASLELTTHVVGNDVGFEGDVSAMDITASFEGFVESGELMAVNSAMLNSQLGVNPDSYIYLDLEEVMEEELQDDATGLSEEELEVLVGMGLDLFESTILVEEYVEYGEGATVEVNGEDMNVDRINAVITGNDVIDILDNIVVKLEDEAFYEAVKKVEEDLTYEEYLEDLEHMKDAFETFEGELTGQDEIDLDNSYVEISFKVTDNNVIVGSSMELYFEGAYEDPYQGEEEIAFRLNIDSQTESFNQNLALEIPELDDNDISFEEALMNFFMMPQQGTFDDFN